MQFIYKKLSLLFIVLSIGSTGALAQPSFSLKTNSDFPAILGTDFGYKIGRFQPYFGLSNYHIKSSYEVTYSQNPLSNYTDDFSATVFLTSLGARYAFRDDGLKPYVFGNVYKLFTSVDNRGISDTQLEDELSPFGMGLGFGAEYTDSKNLAIFGEYGFRALFPSSKDSQTDPFSGDVRTENLSEMFSMVNGSAGIRFYF